jgi:hypothetical protein
MPATRPSLFGALIGDSSDEAQQLAQMMEGLWTAQVITVLVRLGIADLLANGPSKAGDLARDAGADADALGRVLAAAAAYGLVERDGDGRYTLTVVGDLLRSYSPSSASNLAGFLSPPYWTSGSKITEIVRGAAVNPAAPGGIYDFFGSHPDEAQRFARAMGRVTSLLVADLATIGFRALASGRIVDVGGSRGTLLAHLLQADPAAGGVLFDRAEALAEAPAFLAAAGVADRVELARGDFLREVPGGGDLYVLCQVLHNWDDDQVATIVGNCRDAGRPGGSLMVIEYVLPDGPEPSAAHLLDFLMLTVVGGRERTMAQHEALMGAAGYTLVRDTALTAMPWRVMEFQQGG